MSVVDRSAAQAAADEIRTETIEGANTAERIGAAIRNLTDSTRWHNEGAANDSISNAMLANMAAGTIKGRLGTTGDPQDLTGAQATSLLEGFTTSAKGLVPASGGGAANFLRADGSWAPPIQASETAGAVEGEPALTHSGGTFKAFSALRFEGDAASWRLNARQAAAYIAALEYTYSGGKSSLSLGHPTAIERVELTAEYLDLTGGLRLSEFFTDSALDTTIGEYGPAGWAGASVARLAPASGDATIHSFSGEGSGGVGPLKILVNTSASGAIVLEHEGASASVAARRISVQGGGAFSIPPGGVAIIVYDYVTQRWRPISAGGTGGGGGTGTLADALAAGDTVGAFQFLYDGGIGFVPTDDAIGNAAPVQLNAQSSGADDGEGGQASLTAGNGFGFGNGGDLFLGAGDGGATGAAGNVILRPGRAADGAGDRGYVSVSGARVSDLLEPFYDTDAATKAFVRAYVDAASGAIADNAVTNAKLADVPTASFKGRASSGSGDPEDLTAAQATALLELFSDVDQGLVPASGGGTSNFLRADGSWAAPPGGGGGGGVPDDNSVTFAKLADLATDRLIGRDTAGTGDPEAIAVGGGLEFTGAGGIQRSALTGDVTATAGSNATTIANNAVTTAKINNAAVTYAKIQNVSATARLLGRVTAAAGPVEEVSLGTGLEFSGSTLRRSALTGDVTAAAGSNATTIADGAVTNAKIGLGAVTQLKIGTNQVTLDRVQTIASDRLLGRDTGGVGNVEELAVGDGIEFSGSGGIRLADNGVTDAKLLDRMPCSVIGRGPNSVGDPADITAGSDGQVLRRAAGVLAFGAIASAGISDDAVTNAKLADVATGTIKGRATAGTGDVEDLSGAQATGLLSVFSDAAKGLAPASGGGTENFLRADGSWAPPPGGTGGTLADVLAAGDSTSGYSISVSYGDSITLVGDEALSDAGAIRVDGSALAIEGPNAPGGTGLRGGDLVLRAGGGDGGVGDVRVGLGDLHLDNKRVRNVRAVTFNGEVDNGNSGATPTLDWTAGAAQKITLNANATATFTAPAGVTAVTLKIVQDATGGRTWTWPASVKNAPTLTTTANTTSIVSMYWDGSNYWAGLLCTGVA